MSVYGKEANCLLSCVLQDLKNPVFISGCRALGLIDKIVTGSMWRKLEKSSVSILDMSTELKKKFDLWSSDASELIEGTSRYIQDIDIHDDLVWKSLTLSDDSDIQTQELLQLLFNTFSLTTQRPLVDHLPGGTYYNVTDEFLLKKLIMFLPLMYLLKEILLL